MRSATATAWLSYPKPNPQASIRLFCFPYAGGAWREQTSADFVLRVLPGEHLFIHSSQALLLRELSEELPRLANEPRLKF